MSEDKCGIGGVMRVGYLNVPLQPPFPFWQLLGSEMPYGSSDSLAHVYCYMSEDKCGIGGVMRVGYLNVTNSTSRLWVLY